MPERAHEHVVLAVRRLDDLAVPVVLVRVNACAFGALDAVGDVARKHARHPPGGRAERRDSGVGWIYSSNGLALAVPARLTYARRTAVAIPARRRVDRVEGCGHWWLALRMVTTSFFTSTTAFGHRTLDRTENNFIARAMTRRFKVMGGCRTQTLGSMSKTWWYRMDFCAVTDKRTSTPGCNSMDSSKFPIVISCALRPGSRDTA